MTHRVAAVDLGASSGRVMAGLIGPGKLDLTEVHRFWNGPVRLGDRLHWDVLHLYREQLTGLAAAGPVDSVGIDSWAVDYGLLDRDGRLLGNPVHYRDGRTDGVAAEVLHRIPADRLFAITGLQQLPFNTIYQLAAETLLDRADKLLLIPDLLGYWLTGRIGAERTNASTTQLYDVTSRAWSPEIARHLGVPAGLLPQLREPGEVIGPLLPSVAADAGLDRGLTVIAVGSHDTASSVVAVPAESGARFGYISSGTWSLAGLELDAPVLTEAARQANFTNETGLDGTTRFLRNVMGLWLLQECLRSWRSAGTDRSKAALDSLLSAARQEPAFRALVDPDDPTFLAPGNMPERIAEYCERTGRQPPRTPPAVVRCVLESLAVAYRRTLRQAQELSGQDLEVIHIIGGGSQNDLLCQLTADACGLPVLAGPVEASALGNILVQARTLGEPLPDLAAMRTLVRATHQLRRYHPQGRPADWDAAESQVFGSR